MSRENPTLTTSTSPAANEGECRSDSVLTQAPAVMHLAQAAAYLRVSKAHLSNIINGKVPGVLPIRQFAQAVASSSNASGSTNGWNARSTGAPGSDTIRGMPSINAFDAGKRQRNASKAFSERQPAIPQARASSRVGCLLVGGRRPAMQDAGASIADVKGGSGSSALRHSSARSTAARLRRQGRSTRSSSSSTDVYLPFCRRSWKESTAGTSEQIVKSHLVPEFGKALLHAIRREELQDFLDRKALELSSSVVSHLRWFLNGIFKLALSDGLVLNNPAAELRIPRKCQPGRAMRPLTEEEVNEIPGGLRPPGETDCTARNLRGDAARRDFGASMEGARRTT